MMGKLYAALIAANVSEEAARGAAEEIAAYENRFAKLEADMSLLKWMVAFNIAVTIALVSKAFYEAYGDK